MRGTTRRGFLGASLAGGLAGLRAQELLATLPAASAKGGDSSKGVVPLRADLEPLVRVIEETSRDRLLEEIARRIRGGLSYQELLGALFLAAVRNVEPRPSVGFKFHAVLVVNSAHLASLAAPEEDRWLPIFWTLDYFKSAQARDVQQGNWTMVPVEEEAVPSPMKARAAFVEAMERWDVEAADAAVVGLARSAGANEIWELFYRFGCRDFRSIGHKAIFVANAKRTLDCIGWRYAEPVLRSLAYALLNHVGDPNPAQSDLPADRAGRQNLQRREKLRADWLAGQIDDGATREMMAVLREGSSAEACEKAVELINAGIAPQSVWDALLCGAGELLMRRPGIVALHSATSSNALRYAFATSGNPETRQLLLLQNAAFLPLFRESMRNRGKVTDQRLDQLEPRGADKRQEKLIGEIFADIHRNRHDAAAKVLAYLQQATAEPLVDEARRLIFLKGNDSHDYKFSSAVLEDYYHVSPAWRDKYLAASVFKLRGSQSRDNSLVDRVRAAFA